VTLGLLAASLVCVAAELPRPGNAVVGTFGVSAAMLGALVAADVGRSAEALAGLARALRPGRRRAAGPERGVRVFGVYYVVFGVVLAVAGYGGFISWKR
jgi:hypothetical protein